MSDYNYVKSLINGTAKNLEQGSNEGEELQPATLNPAKRVTILKKTRQSPSSKKTDLLRQRNQQLGLELR